MNTDSLMNLSADQAVKTLLPAITEEVKRLSRFAENPMNHLIIKPYWEEVYKDKWPKKYEGKVGNIILTYAIEDRTNYGPLRFKARVLTISYIDVKEAELQASLSVEKDLAIPHILPNKRMQVPQAIARMIANGFFTGPVDERLNSETGDWTFIQVFDRHEPSKIVPFASLPSPL